MGPNRVPSNLVFFLVVLDLQRLACLFEDLLSGETLGIIDRDTSAPFFSWEVKGGRGKGRFEGLGASPQAFFLVFLDRGRDLPPLLQAY
jgi:hypothetical protein